MELTSIKEVPNSWTRLNITLSYAELDSLRILLGHAIDRADISVDTLTKGTVHEFIRTYLEANKPKMIDKISTEVFEGIKKGMEKSLTTLKTYELD